MDDGTVLIRISRDLMATFGTRTEDGKALRFDLGEPTGFIRFMEPVYGPTVTAVDDGMAVYPRRAWRGRALALPVIPLGVPSPKEAGSEP